jgi:hypothetical protein
MPALAAREFVSAIVAHVTSGKNVGVGCERRKSRRRAEKERAEASILCERPEEVP